MISFRVFIRSTVALCAIMTVGSSLAGDGVVRLSDRSSNAGNPSGGAGVVRMNARPTSGIQQASFVNGGACGEQCCPPQSCLPQCCPTQCWTDPCNQYCDPCGNGMCGNGMCGNGMCGNGSCYTPMDCNTYFSSCDSTGMPSCWCSDCQSSPCQCRGRRGRGAGCEDVTIFAGPVDSGTGSACRDGWHGQAMSFRNKNARLADKLFGWLIPSGCCGQGCPPVGKYCQTYADDPGYINPNDTQLYGAQGYGMPMTVPLAPNVYHSYNYSAGIPASRITHIGNYNPMTSPRPLHHQSW